MNKGGKNMISIYKNNATISTENGETKGLELRGLSTDTKPTTLGDKPINNGAMFIEIDTGKLFLFDRDSNAWKEI